MKISATITQNDFQAFSRVAMRRTRERSPWRSLLRFLAEVAIILGGYALLRRLLGDTVDVSLPWVLFGALVGGAIMAYELLRLQRRLLPLPEGAALGHWTFEISDDEIRQHRERFESRAPWSAVIGVEETPHHLFLFVDRCAAFIVPRREVADAAQWQELLAQVREHAP